MRTKEEIKDELTLLMNEEHILKSKITAVNNELVDCVAEFKVGQRVIHSKEVYQITTRRPGWKTGTVRYSGKKVLKSGGLHKKTSCLHWEIKAK